MADFNKENRKGWPYDSDEDDHIGGSQGGDAGGQGGQGGGLAFHDFISIGSEKLTAEQEKQLLAVHKEANSGSVEKQKKLRDQRKDLEEGRSQKQEYGQGSREADFLKHPILGEAAEFDGIDPKVNLDPTIYEADTNPGKQQELTYQHQLRHQLREEPHFNPKPSPF